jgi:hypothetical protein
MLASGSVWAGAAAEFDLAPVEVLLEFLPLAVGDLPVFLGGAACSPLVQEGLVVPYDLAARPPGPGS